MGGSLNGEVSGYDDSGTVGDSRHGLQQGFAEDGETLPQAHEPSSDIESSCSRNDELEAPRLEAKVKSFVDSLTDEERALLADGPENEIIASAIRTWEGMLPDPVSFSQYPDFAQKQMIAWNDARIIDESKRLDKVYDAFIRQKSRGQWMSFAINFLFILATFVSFVVLNGDPRAFGFLAVPGVSIVFNVWRARKSDDDDYDDV